jgi:outer membrane protein assembly factor BamB
MTHLRVRARLLVVAAVASLDAAQSAFAQLDLLRPLKVTQPNVIVALDLSSRMQQDPAGVYLDPAAYRRTGAPFEAAIGVDDRTTDSVYRRRYVGLAWGAPGGIPRATCLSVEAVGDLDARFAALDGRTRIGRARAAIARAVEGNAASLRFGLVASRQALVPPDPTLPPIIATAQPGAGFPTDTGEAGRWRTGLPVTSGPSAERPPAAPLVAADGAGAGVLTRLLALPPGAPGALMPAGWDTAAAVDAPVAALLRDARAEAGRLIAADDTCRNTIVVLVAAGADPAVGSNGLADEAALFLAVAGRRVPVYVVALAPPPDDAVRLRAAAERSGGQYFEIGPQMLERVAPPDPVPEIVAAIHAAIQHAFASFTDFNVAPSADRPYGVPSYFPTVGPVIGTVDLTNAVDAAGNLLPSTHLTAPDGSVLPQPSNLMVTAGFELPGFVGRLSAFRVYRPVVDAGKATGYRFSSDGTRVWTAWVPDADRRNLFTVLPGAGVVPFTTSNAALLAPWLGVPNPAGLIEAVRALPLGPSFNSTPALLEPPSGRFADPDYATFLEVHRHRRSLVFAGADDGMMHAFDARTGIEVWAVVPFNLLPKLRRLPEGLAIDAFPFFVEGSPRLADAKVAGRWRSCLLFGQGPGGTFYQAFDVTLDHIETDIPPDADPLPAVLAWFAEPSRIPFVWSYPRYEMFDPAVLPDGELRAAATDAEKSVGESWSTPLVGRAGLATGPFVAVVGSGPMARSREEAAARRGTRAGTRAYILDIATGALLDSRDVGNDGLGENQDGCPAAGCTRLKNAIQADPVASQDGEGTIVSAYAGDLDGRLWRFDLSGGGAPGFTGAPTRLYAGGADQPIFGNVARLAGSGGPSYLFFGTGSELLPRSDGLPAHRLVGMAEGAAGTMTRFERLLRTAATDGIDERLAGAPVVAGSVVFFATTSRIRGGCEAGECSLYALTLAGGVAYDVNGDGRRDGADTPAVVRRRLGRAAAPVVADRHLFVATGERVQVFGDPDGFAGGPPPIGLRILSWREVRRP